MQEKAEEWELISSVCASASEDERKKRKETAECRNWSYLNPCSLATGNSPTPSAEIEPTRDLAPPPTMHYRQKPKQARDNKTLEQPWWEIQTVKVTLNSSLEQSFWQRVRADYYTPSLLHCNTQGTGPPDAFPWGRSEVPYQENYTLQHQPPLCVSGATTHLVREKHWCRGARQLNWTLISCMNYLCCREAINRTSPLLSNKEDGLLAAALPLQLE